VLSCSSTHENHKVERCYGHFVLRSYLSFLLFCSFFLFLSHIFSHTFFPLPLSLSFFLCFLFFFVSHIFSYFFFSLSLSLSFFLSLFLFFFFFFSLSLSLSLL